jgi:hypothetical protein
MLRLTDHCDVAKVADLSRHTIMRPAHVQQRPSTVVHVVHGQAAHLSRAWLAAACLNSGKDSWSSCKVCNDVKHLGRWYIKQHVALHCDPAFSHHRSGHAC